MVSEETPPGGRPDKQHRAFVVPLIAGAAYGLVMRVVFGRAGGAFEILSLGFLLCVPAAMGFYVAWLTPTAREGRALFLSACAVLCFLVGAAVTHLEGAICVAMMAPVAFVIAGITALVTSAVRASRERRGRDRGGPGPMLAVGLLPFAVAGIERAAGHAEAPVVVETATTIRAPLDVVWANVVRVPAIRDEERETTFFHRIGFPRPIEATIDRPGLGAVRHASFERGAVFVETVNVWREREEIAFSIDPSLVPPTAFDEHVSPGGPHFTTLEGRYRLEPAPGGAVRLVLTSRSRLSSTVNWYAGPWVKAAMRSVQEDILCIVKARCERGETPR